MSSNLISRSTVNAFTKSFSPSADPRYSYWVSRIFFVILEIFAGHILRQWCMECDVGWYSRQRRRRLLQFLRARRSPYTYNSYYEYYAWYVTSSGRVVDDYTYGVLNSYGRSYDRRAHEAVEALGLLALLASSSTTTATMSATIPTETLFFKHIS